MLMLLVSLVAISLGMLFGWMRGWDEGYDDGWWRGIEWGKERGIEKTTQVYQAVMSPDEQRELLRRLNEQNAALNHPSAPKPHARVPLVRR